MWEEVSSKGIHTQAGTMQVKDNFRRWQSSRFFRKVLWMRSICYRGDGKLIHLSKSYLILTLSFLRNYLHFIDEENKAQGS